jgi:crotonobetainyl-CoA:carnitine CoA-transferase CaiB-like acyl-CoA transferase
LPFDEVIAGLRRHDTIFAALATPLEVLADPQVAANGYFPAHPVHPRARLAAAPVQFDDTLPEIRRAAPGIGEHTESVLAEFGVSEAEIATLRASGAIA